MTVPLLNLCDAHTIKDKSLLNLLNGFHFSNVKILKISDAILMLKTFLSFVFANENPTGIHHTHSQAQCLWLMLSAGETKFMHAHAPIPFPSCAAFASMEKKITSDTLLIDLVP